MASDSEPDDDGLELEDDAEEYEQDLEDEPDAAQDEATEDGDEVCAFISPVSFFHYCAGVALGRL